MADNNQQAFFALLRAGLWEQEVQLLPYGEADFAEVLRLAEEQSVVGLVAAGLEHVTDMKPAKKDVLQFIGQAMQLEQRNTAMNYFIGVLVDKMREAGIETLLVKGQGIAQCYERPLWRACGDVDFFLSAKDYEKAKGYLIPLASSVDPERVSAKHLGMTIDPWVVELHGTLNGGLSSRTDRQLDSIMQTTLRGGNVRQWMNGATEVSLPRADEDVIYVFTHILEHFYKGGIGLRQICDWSRLLWTQRDSIDRGLLEQRLRGMGIMSEWKAFGAFAVSYLGLPVTAYGLLFINEDIEAGLRKKARLIMEFVMEVGNFGHNRDNSYYCKYPYVIRKVMSLGVRCGDLFRHARIFPLDSLRFFPKMMLNGLVSAIKGEG